MSEPAPSFAKGIVPTPIGELVVVAHHATILIAEFGDRDDRIARQIRQYHADASVTACALDSAITKAFEAYFRGEITALDTLETNPKGTDYEMRVWHRLRAIPAGSTTSYGALARELGSSARAIGRANGRNPIGLIHPCHRVIGADGTLTGYAGGLERKDWLLRHEGALSMGFDF